MGRRGWLAGLLAMTVPGLGGQQPPPQNSAPAAPLVPGIQPGVTNRFVTLYAGNTIINPNGVFIYSGTPGVGDLIASMTHASTDPFGNHTIAGVASYAIASASALNGGFQFFYRGSLSSGWTEAAELATDPDQDLLLTSNGQITANGNPIG